jgi:riboflavin kinase/FMN adenylyltransferase
VVAVSWEGRRFQGMCNIGRRPTISRSNFSIEIHIIDFDRDIYDEYIAVCFLKRIRDEKKFENLRKLSEQLEKDKATTLQYFKKSENRL